MIEKIAVGWEAPVNDEYRTIFADGEGVGQYCILRGAGVSTESGIPDFRSVDGLYNQKYDYPSETILSHSFYIKYPEEVYRFYRDKMLCLDAEPNITHKKAGRA